VYEARVTVGSYGDVGGALISGPFGVPYPTPDAGGNYYKVDGFGRRVTSTHDYVGGSWGAYGGGIFGTTATVPYNGSSIPSVGVGDTLIKMDCGSCHDVHGSSNYRLLKDKVYGVTVGGYDTSSNPTPYVVSNETNFPAGGFRLHVDAIGAGYRPNYTTPMYRKPLDNSPQKGMSGWCVGCHTFYMGDSASIATTYNAGDGFGSVERHRHPINVPLSNFNGPRSLDVTTNAAPLPLAHDPGETTAEANDWIDCMTCHYAHGTTAIMTGYANVRDPADMVPDSGYGGVPPTDDSALLRFNNRYVCQNCHNK
jgi:predicted CXXCH cytochrome family protein